MWLLFIFIIYFLVFFSIQTSLLDLIAIAGVTPDLALILTLYGTVILKNERSIAVGCFIGFIQDCFSAGILGVNTLSKGLISFIFSGLRKNIIVEGFIPIAIFSFVSSLFDGLVFYFSSLLLFKAGASLTFLYSKLIVYSLYNAAIAPIIFYLLNSNKNWLIKKFPGFEGAVQ